jgi:hypothetical protein
MTTTTTSANVVSKSRIANAIVDSKSATQASAKTQRVLETRDSWSVIFNHTVALVAKCAKGETLSDDDRKGFAFGKVADQPHSRGYAQSLLAGFVSRKANKFLGEVDGLKTIEERTKIALAILTATKLGGNTTEKAKALLSKAEPKQAKTISEAVKSALNEVQAVAEEDASPKGKKAADDGKGKRGGSKGTRKGTRKAADKA